MATVAWKSLQTGDWNLGSDNVSSPWYDASTDNIQSLRASFPLSTDPNTGDTVTLYHDLTAEESVSCVSVTSNSTTIRTLTIDDTANVLAGTVSVNISGATIYFQIAQNAHCVDTALEGCIAQDDTTYKTGMMAESVATATALLFPVGAPFTVASFSDTDHNGDRISLGATATLAGANSFVTITVSTMTTGGTPDTGGTITRWVPIQINIGNVNQGAGIAKAIDIASTGYVSVSITTLTSIRGSTSGTGSVYNDGFITTISGTFNIQGTGRGVYNSGYITTISGTFNTSSSSTAARGIYNPTDKTISMISGTVNNASSGYGVYNNGTITMISGIVTGTAGTPYYGTLPGTLTGSITTAIPDLAAENILAGKTILGAAGTYVAVAAANVRKDTAVGVSPAVGTLDIAADNPKTGCVGTGYPIGVLGGVDS